MIRVSSSVMKQKFIPNIIRIALAAGAVTLVAAPLQAGRGGNGAGGDCPQGFEPGTRNTENCTGDRIGAASRKGNGNQVERGQNRGQGTCDGTGQGQGGKGQGGGRGQGGGQGIGNPEDCPIYNSRTLNP